MLRFLWQKKRGGKKTGRKKKTWFKGPKCLSEMLKKVIKIPLSQV